jgi:hypothetical protein
VPCISKSVYFIHNITSRRGILADQYLTRYDQALLDLNITFTINNEDFFAKINKDAYFDQDVNFRT